MPGEINPRVFANEWWVAIQRADFAAIVGYVIALQQYVNAAQGCLQSRGREPDFQGTVTDFINRGSR